MPNKRRVIYLAFDNLNRNYGALKDANPETDLILFVESNRMLRSQVWHFQRLYFLISSARHFAEELTREGFSVEYIRSENTKIGIQEVINKYNLTKVIGTYPSSFRLQAELEGLVEFVENDFFLTPRSEFAKWASSGKKLLMENFYRIQRKRLNILMDGDEPIGGKWNFDADNRSAVPDGHKFPAYLEHAQDDLDKEVIVELLNSDIRMWGDAPSGTWATTRAGALLQLEHFLKNNLAEFGPYEDASTTENWALHHSLLSPYLNNGLLHAEEVLEATRKHISKKQTPIASLEGFIRQVIGWREYVNGIYWQYGYEYRESNHFKHTGELPPLFDNPEITEINCVKSVVADVQKRSWVHHIPRLMILSNFAQLTNTKPQALLAWMRRVFIDATDWVMVPNVIGMSMHADGGKMMSKPYLAGGSYISKMTNYCKGCRFNPKLRTGADACPFTALYWNFVDQNYESLSKNPRILKQISGIKRLKDMDLVRNESGARIAAIRAGKL